MNKQYIEPTVTISLLELRTRIAVDDEGGDNIKSDIWDFDS